MAPDFSVDEAELTNRFTYHSPTEDQLPRYTAIRAKAREFAELIVEETPVSREQGNALSRLDEVVFHANAAIARRS
jgi:hypothetical protein